MGFAAMGNDAKLQQDLELTELAAQRLSDSLS